MIGSWVMYGTPSDALGTVNPWKCTVVGCVIWLFTTTRTLSPCRTRISGPGICPLKAIASTNDPGETSHLTSAAVSSKTFHPSWSVGRSGWLPVPAVSAGKASTPALWLLAISSADMGIEPDDPAPPEELMLMPPEELMLMPPEPGLAAPWE